jgi:phosphoribosylformylglycinamidine cyclo-ligase
VIDLDAWQLPEVFRWLQETGGIAEDEMLRTFNCGIGMIVCVDPADESAAVQRLMASGEKPVVMGEVVAGAPLVNYGGRL